MSSRFIDSLNITPELLELKNWPKVNTNHFNQQELEIFRNRRKAVELYFNSKPLKEITLETGIAKQDLYRFIRRCLKEDKFGVIWGYRALIPNKTLKEYRKKADNHLNSNKMVGPGAFTLLLITYPELEEVITDLLFKKNNKVPTDKIMAKKYIHKHFIKKCKELGLKTPYDYPFTSKDLGQRIII
ncbi:hypothetical protein [Alkalihalobacillus sp. 1P02AB]|uniref:hypothetical protein n=1 Tax=Alkalihalobacillus sp. 1P02AB TaxID=3132260 RepID=UPI0039A7005C